MAISAMSIITMTDAHPLVCRFGALGDMVLLTPLLCIQAGSKRTTRRGRANLPATASTGMKTCGPSSLMRSSSACRTFR
jgi:hypothetical protein